MQLYWLQACQNSNNILKWLNIKDCNHLQYSEMSEKSEKKSPNKIWRQCLCLDLSIINWRFFQNHNSPLHVLLWASLSGTLSGTLRIVFQSHLVLCALMRLIVRNNFIFCSLHNLSIFFSKFWYFIIVINLIFLANSKNSLTLWMRSKLSEM